MEQDQMERTQMELDQRGQTLMEQTHPCGAGHAAQAKRNSVKQIWIFLIGMLWGSALMFFGGVLFLRHNLLEERRTDRDFDSVISDLHSGTGKAPGWEIRNAGCPLPPSGDGCRMQSFQLCQRDYASELIEREEDRKISALLPCTFSVYEKKDGHVYLSRLNVKLLGRLLGGMPAYVFPAKVSPEQERFLGHLKFQ